MSEKENTGNHCKGAVLTKVIQGVSYQITFYNTRTIQCMLLLSAHIGPSLSFSSLGGLRVRQRNVKGLSGFIG